MLGHLLELRRRPLAFLTSLREHGDLVELRFGPQRAYVVCHPDLIQQVLLDSRTFDKGGRFNEKVRKLLGNGVITSDWGDHRRQRRLMQPGFHQDRLATYADVMRDEAAAVAAAWRAGAAIDVNEATHAIAARVTTRALFSTGIDADVVADVQRAIPTLLKGIYRRTVAPFGLLERLPLPATRRFDRSMARVRVIIDQIILDRQHAVDDRGDVLSMLLAARDENTGEGMSDAELRDQALSLLLAGTETVATTLAWTFFLLDRHPEVERRLHDEVDDVLAGRPVTFDDLPELEYTRRVLDETLRIYSPAWLSMRVTTTEAELGGLRMPAGTTVLLSSYALHHDPELFPDPDRFDPDRWLHDRAKTVPRNAMIPFGAGSRKCIGDVFATIEATIVLATVAGGWQLRGIPGTTMRPHALATLGPGPLSMVTHARSSLGRRHEVDRSPAAGCPLGTFR